MLTTTILSSAPCYNGTMLKQDYYNEFFDLGQQKINFSFFELHFPEDDPVSVSYTHLDVYKRQIVSSILVPPTPGSQSVISKQNV